MISNAANILSFLGDGATLSVASFILFLGASYFKKKQLQFRLYNLLALLGVGIALCYLLKVSVGRARPFNLEGGFSPFNFSNAFHSFPSSHAALSMTVALFIRKWPTTILATLIGLSRVWLMKHHLSDVLAGFLISYLLVYQLDKVFVFQLLKEKIAAKIMGKSFDLPKKL